MPFLLPKLKFWPEIWAPQSYYLLTDVADTNSPCSWFLHHWVLSTFQTLLRLPLPNLSAYTSYCQNSNLLPLVFFPPSTAISNALLSSSFEMSLPFDPSATPYFETSLLPPFSQIACILACIKLNLPSIFLVEVFLLNKNLILSLFHLKILQLVSNVNKMTLCGFWNISI